jgi:peptidoglycan-associated lipoprotein
MKRSINRLLPVLCAGMFVYGGCASQEVVKNDEPLVPAASTASHNQGATTANASDKAIAAKNVKSSDDQNKSQQQHKAAGTDTLHNAFENIYFDFDSSALSDAARQSLVKNFAVLKQNPQSRIRVEGHCDERGSGEYNLALGERRAQAAVRYLTTMGVQAGRLSTISCGKEKPAVSGHDEEAWAKNRRDEFAVSK